MNIKQFYHILFKRLLTIKIYKPLKLFSNFLFLVWLVTSKYYMSIRHFLLRVWSEIRKKNINIWLEAWKIILNWSNRRDQFILKIFFVYIKCVLFKFLVKMYGDFKDKAIIIWLRAIFCFVNWSILTMHVQSFDW